MILSLFRKSSAPPSVERVYADIVAAARAPALYRAMGVPDTVMGRFEALALFMSLALRRLKMLPEPAEALSQELVDRFFADLDLALREIGIGDVSVPKKVKALGAAFYGRLAAYDAALAEDAGASDLEAALARNVLERPDAPGLASVLAGRVREIAGALDHADMDAFLTSRALPPAGDAA
ncbi:MAG: ubiquinol-cytochrome C chaperone family protein [Beijerinckiaceae bacterium]